MGTHVYSYGETIFIIANANSGYKFSSWTYEGTISIPNPLGTQTYAGLLGNGTITANFIAVSQDKLLFTAGTSQVLGRNAASTVITVQRQTSTGSLITSGTTTLGLESTSSGGKFYKDAACTQQITASSPLTIANTKSSASFYYRDSNTGTQTLTASAANFASVQTTFNVNLCYSNFDGSNWLYGWTAGTQPPWYQGVGEGFDGTDAAKSDSSTTYPNDGPFTSSEIDTSVGNTITITFRYRVQNTNAATDLQIAYSTQAYPDLTPHSPSFNYIGNLGLPQSNEWQSYALTFTRAQTPSVFTSSFWFRFESNLDTHSGGVMESVWVDNFVLSVS